MSECIDYSKVDWRGLVLSNGFVIETDFGMPIVYDALHGVPVARYNGQQWRMCCGIKQINDALESIKKVDEHAKKYIAKQSAKRTEAARVFVDKLKVDSHYLTGAVLVAHIDTKDIDRIFKGMSDYNHETLEVVINKVG